MKYIIICLVVMAVAFAAGYFLTRLIWKLRKKKRTRLKSFFSTLGIGVLIILVVTAVYLNTYYHPDDTALAAMEGSSTVSVEEVDGGYFFDGPGTEAALVFYQGAKVDEKAYAPLMLRLSEEGIDCFLAKMPFRFAIFGGNIADKFTKAYDYETWIMSGHSMGGIMASAYANNNSDIIDAVVFLASYPTDTIDDSIELCSIYGTCDNCLDKKEYENGRQYWPRVSSEHILEGANHAGFGNYGVQPLDGTATISAEEQQKMTVDVIKELQALK